MFDSITVEHGATVEVWELLGHVASPSKESDIVYSSLNGQTTHLHLKVEVATQNNVPTEILVVGK